MRGYNEPENHVRRARPSNVYTRGAPPVRSRVLVLAAATVLCAVTGIAAGLLTHGVVDALTRSSAAATATKTSTSSPSQTANAPTATVPAASTVIPDPGFTLSAVASPNTVAAGQHVTVTATIVAPNGATPLVGVQITLQAPEQDLPGLLSQWPDPAISDAQGHVTWELTVPAAAAGTYGVEVRAMGAHKYSYHYVTRITVTAG
jgi:hypothetical protein